METCNLALKWAMRIGYGARGMVYLTVGILAVFAAINGGEAEGSTGALAYLARQPFGKVLLAMIAGGLFAYAGWRFIDAVLDLEDEGLDPEGIGNRLGQFLSGTAHAVLGLSAIGIILNIGNSGGGSGAESSTEMVMDYPGGRWLVIIAGLVTGSVGIYLLVKACHSRWKSTLDLTHIANALLPFVRFGLVAHGLVVLIVAGLFIWAGFTLDSDKAGGLEEALAILESQAFGRVILFVTGLGLVGFSAYCFVYSRYRHVPKLSEDGEDGAGPDAEPVAAYASDDSGHPNAEARPGATF